MSAVRAFSAELLRWGRVYGVDVPAEVSVSFGVGGHVPVAGRVNGRAFHATLIPGPGARHRLFLEAELRSALRAEPGDLLEVMLERDPSNRVPPVPDDLAEALEILTGARARFDAWPPSHRREILLWIAEAVRPETRSRRIARAVARIMESA